MGKLKHIMIGGLAVVASALTMQAQPTYPKMYILGQNEEGDAWNPTKGIEKTTEDGIWYTATVTTVAGRENFAIVRNLAENNDDAGWKYVNQQRYGLANDNQDAAVAVNTQECTLSVARGMYVVVVDGHATKVVVR